MTFVELSFAINQCNSVNSIQYFPHISIQDEKGENIFARNESMTRKSIQNARAKKEMVADGMWMAKKISQFQVFLTMIANR